MSLWQKLLGKEDKPPEIKHPLFGPITFRKRHGWENQHFELWGYSDVQLMIDTDERGPTALQDAAFVRFRDARETLLPRCLAAVAAQREETELPPGRPNLRSLSIPSLVRTYRPAVDDVVGLPWRGALVVRSVRRRVADR